MVHDSVRPFVEAKTIKKLIEQTEDYGAVVLGTMPKDPIKEVNAKSEIVKTIQRNKIAISQTPQCFWKEIITTAYTKARNVNYTGSDSSQLAEFAGYKVFVVEGSELNIKITTQFDLKLAALVLNEIRNKK
jgi:2-C-methyl-D-erythritol 4-phosphate cytidylyltransferase